MTVARTDRQQRNRAFAAELLAPADWLRERIGGTWVTSDDVDEWAAELGVSPDVVDRQIENHRLTAMAGY
jgi:Zn-dependent peptidase ImmA (M78 family)